MKEKLIQHMLQMLVEKIATAITEIDIARETQQNETKSSAGDKYETTREMMTQEIEKHTQSLAIAEQQKSILTQITMLKPNATIGLGSLVQTNYGNYFISTGMGNIIIDGISVVTISIQSPLGIQLMRKKKNDTIFFKGNTIKIIEIV